MLDSQFFPLRSLGDTFIFGGAYFGDYYFFPIPPIAIVTPDQRQSARGTLVNQIEASQRQAADGTLFDEYPTYGTSSSRRRFIFIN